MADHGHFSVISLSVCIRLAVRAKLDLLCIRMVSGIVQAKVFLGQFLLRVVLDKAYSANVTLVSSAQWTKVRSSQTSFGGLVK